ncbi:DUF3265 domain-containing protein [Vibrio vulnificus]|nr:DUF3265 domain-containing protein [Vibrio vulnificus]EIA1338629.1 DUF3265 domain-containing protein [Vibrio vulnificus]EIA1774818.1 DUF3265 domain-containing protein [Vibrio vulnificus]EIU7597610.1 DUF3265 domain-containing protein [Vibrio vulnificus]EIX4871608.1 DUF3265 domain-containing protein [Vibrio vulnificus]
MTKRLSGIWHAWHFQFALGSVIKSLCGSFCSACLHPLTRRYVYLYFKDLKVLGFSSLSLWQFVPSRLSKSALST